MKMWNKNFILLLQGQAVSSLGDALYAVIVGLWVYEVTGSAKMMSVVFAAASITRLIFFPFAGYIVDRYNRRNIVIFCDAIRGALMLLIGFYTLLFPTSGVWFLILYSIISALCSSVFNPSANTLLLSAVSRDNFVRANSLYYMSNYVVNIIGQGIAGVIFVIFGAPVMFIIDGITFLLSAFSELFISKDISVVKNTERVKFTESAMAGIQYILKNRGLLYSITEAFIINFAFGAVRVLLVPWLSSYGEEYYGIYCAFQSVGTLIGTGILSMVNIQSQYRHKVYFSSQIARVTLMALAAIMTPFPLIVLFACMGYSTQYIYNSLQSSMVTIAIPDELRGKVLCAIQAIAMACSPLGNLAAGFLGDVFSPRKIIIALMALCLVVILGISSKKEVRMLLTGE